ncbi:hypothetical protein [Streptomyces wuyuanensis]|uniref:hypothetical protein n=1 Tax=Streptomyces wuyuanensis TaxID=1196353 RepID=UPI003428E5BD
MYRTREWLFERIREDHRLDPKASLQALAMRHQVSQAAVAEALCLAFPVRQKRERPSVLAPVKPAIDQMLREDLSAPPGERLTIRQIVERLRTEQGFTRGSYSTVRDYVRLRRAALAKEAGAAGAAPAGGPAQPATGGAGLPPATD